MTPFRRRDQMRLACGVRGGVTSPPIARPRVPGVPSAQRSTLRRSIDARFRDVEWEEAACAHTGWLSVRTAAVLMAQGLMPARPRGSPSMQRGGGVRRPLHEGSGGFAPGAAAPAVEEEGELDVEEIAEPVGGGVEAWLAFLGLGVMGLLFFSFVHFLFFFCRGSMGRKPWGHSHYDCASWSGCRKWVYWGKM